MDAVRLVALNTSRPFIKEGRRMHNRDVTYRAICCSCTISARAVKWLQCAICRGNATNSRENGSRDRRAVYIYNGTMHFCAHEHRGVIAPLASVQQKRAGFGEKREGRWLDRSATGFHTRGGNSASSRFEIISQLHTSEIWQKKEFPFFSAVFRFFPNKVNVLACVCVCVKKSDIRYLNMLKLCWITIDAFAFKIQNNYSEVHALYH